MAFLNDETEACGKRIGELVSRVNLLSHPAGEAAAKLFVLAALKPLAAHQRRRAMKWILGHEMLRGVFE